MTFRSITNLARLIDGEKLRERNDDFDDRFACAFSEATDHLGIIFCQEADGIYDAVMHKMKIEYVRDIQKQARKANEKFLDLATELTFVSHKAFFELEALHRGNFTDEDYFVWDMHCDHENQLERHWQEYCMCFVNGEWWDVENTPEGREQIRQILKDEAAEPINHPEPM